VPANSASRVPLLMPIRVSQSVRASVLTRSP
jgi:hypothetical protein